ncbi:IS5 family transposase domain protein [Rickettsiales endosymbiont of Paramecium tredecaurelia]|uniref:helix-turn-helix domain-containing protein n=1 Tax=Candidatus Sarmatiella mevalonica TaxID=2770581 RepID=UPI001922BBB1|nr:transposase family protein [Candidatus Sarmatiella mevalonica]MBL3285223.1 IS5 family transposase domain protein [Candidatus Sarmatiella mevalonica]
MIRYSKIAKHPRVFLRLFGMELEKFEIIIKKLEKIWDKRVVGQYKRPGRNYKLGLEEMTLMLLMYLRTYSTMMQIGFMFNIDESRVSRIIKKLEPQRT